MIGTDTASTAGFDGIRARSRAPFLICSTLPSRYGYHHHSFSVSSTTGAGSAVRTLDVASTAVFTDVDGTRHDTGTITNNTDTSVRFSEVVATFYDTWGNVVSVDNGDVNRLDHSLRHPPGQVPFVPRGSCCESALGPGETGTYEMTTYHYDGYVRVVYKGIGLE